MQCLLVVLENYADGIRLLAGFEVLAFIYVEEAHAAQQFALRAVYHLLNISHGDRSIYEQREVALHGLGLWQVGKCHLLLERHLHESVPVELGEEHFLSHIELLQDSLLHDTHLTDVLSATVVDGECSRENVV